MRRDAEIYSLFSARRLLDSKTSHQVPMKAESLEEVAT
jgi:hypothetical protein